MAGIEDKWQDGERTYRAFLLRCWQESELGNGGEPTESFVWRFALTCLDNTHDMKGFSSVEALLAYLQSEFGKKCSV